MYKNGDSFEIKHTDDDGCFSIARFDDEQEEVRSRIMAIIESNLPAFDLTDEDNFNHLYNDLIENTNIFYDIIIRVEDGISLQSTATCHIDEDGSERWKVTGDYYVLSSDTIPIEYDFEFDHLPTNHEIFECICEDENIMDFDEIEKTVVSYFNRSL